MFRQYRARETIAWIGFLAASAFILIITISV